MKSNFTIIKEEYNPNTYETTVTIHTNLGDFTGYTVADEIDAQYPSIHNGNAIAMNKALQKFAKAAIRQLKAELKVMRGLIDSWGLVDPKDEDPYVDVFAHQYRQFRNKETELSNWQTRLANLQKAIQTRVQMRDDLVAKYIAKDKKD